MRLKSLEMNLEWPVDLPLIDLRSYVIERLIQHGQPLRWAITKVILNTDIVPSKQIKVEAVVIVF